MLGFPVRSRPRRTWFGLGSVVVVSVVLGVLTPGRVARAGLVPVDKGRQITYTFGGGFFLGTSDTGPVQGPTSLSLDKSNTTADGSVRVRGMYDALTTPDGGSVSGEIRADRS